MKLVKGDMWSVFNRTDHFLITTNSFVKRNGELVMGKGIADEAKRRFPELPKILGAQIKHLDTYGALCAGEFETEGDYLPTSIWAFQVKAEWFFDANAGLIRKAVNVLKAMALSLPDKRFDLNYPGIGNGKLSENAVSPIIEELPDNVNVWKFR